MSDTTSPNSPELHSLPIIGHVEGPLRQKFAAPRQPGLVEVESYIRLKAPYGQAEAVKGLENFSHLWVIWQFHEVSRTSFKPSVRPPRLGGNASTGVFATRSMFRPSNMGMSVVRLESVSVEHGLAVLKVVGGDMIHGTPVLDLKPYLPYSDCLPQAKAAGFERPAQVSVEVAEPVQAWLKLHNQSAVLPLIMDLVALDPRPAYKKQNFSIQRYVFDYADLKVEFFCKPDTNTPCLVIDSVSWSA